MDIRQLRYFQQVCADGSLQKASRNLFVSQQALSKSISALEHEVGVPLFQRTSRGLTPNETGLLLRALAQPVTDSMDQLLDQLQMATKLSTAQLSLGIASGLEFFMKRADLDTFFAAHPDIHVALEEHPYDRCEQLVESGKLTAALINGPVSSKKVLSSHLLRCQRIAIVQKASPLAQKEQLRISDLRNCPFALNINNRCYQIFLSLCRQNGFEPEVYRAGDLSTMLNLCEEQGYTGLSIDFLLLRAWPSHPSLVALPLSFSDFYYPVDLIVNPAQYHNKNVQHLIDFVCKTVLAAGEATKPIFPYDFT